MNANLLNRKENIFGDNIASAEHWDFSKANMSDTNRIEAVTRVASICYQNPKVIAEVMNGVGNEALYNRLMGEAVGLPSSSFEMVPMLFKKIYLDTIFGITNSYGLILEDTNILKYSEKIIHDDEEYLLTNFRAVVYDFENLGIDLRDHFNTEEECEIIKQYYQVFRFKVDMPTRSQMVRHRVNFQELSRRYVSGKKVPVEHYISDKMKNVVSTMTWTKKLEEVCCGLQGDDLTGFAGVLMGYLAEDVKIDYNTQQVIDICMNHYYQALEDGVKPQEARRIIPQTAYTEFWMGFLPFQLDNFFRLRDDSHAQWEVNRVAIAMKEMLNLPIDNMV